MPGVTLDPSTFFLFCFLHRNHYSDFIDEMIIQPGRKKYNSNRCDVTEEDHVCASGFAAYIISSDIYGEYVHNYLQLPMQ